MSIIDIANTKISQYSPEELLNYCLSGVVVCNGKDLTEFVQMISSYYVDKIESISTDADDGRYDDGYEDAVEEMKRYLESM